MKTPFIALVLLIATAAHAELPLEPLYGHLKTDQGIAIQVYSGGCTTKESFTAEKNHISGITEISFIRNRPDYCEAYLKYGRMLFYTYDEMGLQIGDAYKLMNPEISVHVIR